jgi:hypothetical protein
MSDETPAPEPEITYPFGVDHAAYIALVGAALVPAETWPRYAFDAQEAIRQATRGLSAGALDSDELAACKQALVRVAEHFYRADSAVSSEKIGPYAVTYDARSIQTREGAASVARRTLAGSGLLYTGIQQTPKLLVDPVTGEEIGLVS